MSEVNAEVKQPISALKIVKIVANVIFYLLILFILLVSIANIRAGSKADSMPNIFGRGYLNVASDSMSGTQKDSFNKGDMVVVTNLTDNDSRQKAANKLKVGDIVTFYDSSLNLNGKKLNTHRVVYVCDFEDDGKVDWIFTMGDKYAERFMLYDNKYSQDAFAKQYGEGIKNKDANVVASVNDLIEGGNLQQFDASCLRGTYVKTLGGVGNFANTIQKWGLLIVVLPLCIFLGFEIFFFVRNLLAYRKAKYVDLHGDEIEAERLAEKERLKAELRKELLEEMNNEKEFKNQINNDNTIDAQNDSNKINED